MGPWTLRTERGRGRSEDLTGGPGGSANSQAKPRPAHPIPGPHRVPCVGSTLQPRGARRGPRSLSRTHTRPSARYWLCFQPLQSLTTGPDSLLLPWATPLALANSIAGFLTYTRDYVPCFMRII